MVGFGLEQPIGPASGDVKQRRVSAGRIRQRTLTYRAPNCVCLWWSSLSFLLRSGEKASVSILTRCSKNHHDEPEHQPGDVIDRDACMGSGNYLFRAPSVFGLDDDGVALVCGDMAGREDEVRKAAANCPTAAIHLAGILTS
jgi:ferredoxin